MEKKTSAHYQREFRKRLRERGLIKKEVWIHPDAAGQLREVEQLLRTSPAEQAQTGATRMSEKNKTWKTTELYTALVGSELNAPNLAAIELIDGADPSIHIEMKEYGDLPIFITVAGEQIIVESILWPRSLVNDDPAFNEAILRTHKYFPLSTISLETSSGEDYYHMFGSLSAMSGLDDVLVEIDALAANVINATEAYKEFLNTTA